MRRRDFFGLAALPFSVGKAATARACIVVRLTGGPSQLDTWDMKPDAPGDIRGPFRPIKTSVPGIEISEIFPRMAKHADQYALIRSVHHTETTHESASELIPHSGSSGSFHNARRLVEAGARVINIEMFESVFDDASWDVHGWKPFSPLKSYKDVVGPKFDAAYSGLLEDLAEHGLLETTLVVALGEFGRSPKINPDGGRDHWPHCYTVVMAGGGIRGGQVYGSSDTIGAEPRDNPVTPAMIAATIRKAMGLPVAVDEPPPLHPLFA
jgi:hypothetical protein